MRLSAPIEGVYLEKVNLVILTVFLDTFSQFLFLKVYVKSKRVVGLRPFDDKSLFKVAKVKVSFCLHDV